jgi:uncharacterized membrane protein SpoIIM required for sporulation
MRETKFIKQNQEKWAEFEGAMDRTRNDPDKLNELFVQITDDLSYSRTFYPNRSVRVYLNGLAQRIFFKIYSSRRSPARRLVSFWVDELPQLMYEARSALRLSFAVFVLAFLIGMVSSAYDSEFLRLILGDSYVDMTKENIESGDPMAVYKQKGAFGMSVGITFNNIFVAFLTFVMGAFFTIGSIAILIRNGIMLGAFQYFFIEQGLFWDSFLTVWIHGTLEISAIIIAGAAGITMGKGLAFPGTYTRAKAFQQSARRGIKIMAGIVPIFIIAGFIEGYLTRHTETPDLLRGMFILVCLLFVLLYFVWYPIIKAQMGFDANRADSRVPPDRKQELQFDRILSGGDIFAGVFVFLRKHFGALALASGIGALLYIALAFLPGDIAIVDRFRFPAGAWSGLQEVDQFFRNVRAPLLPLANTLGFATVGTVVFRRLMREEGQAPVAVWAAFLKLLVPMGVFAMLLYFNGWYLPFMLMALLVLPGLWGHISLRNGRNPFAAGSRSLSLLFPNFSRGFSLSLLFLLVGLLFFSLVNTTLSWFYLDLFSWVVQLPAEAMAQFSTIVLTFISVWVLYLVMAMVLVSGGLLYYSLIEIQEAPQLRQRIQDIGLQRRIQGLEKE